ncbi:hypothetical protein HQ38_03370 [Porphyromonas crevioricanis]|uniref:Uncharacterized protein n=1 Tax=Porphyromonas crevioricanis TaxID=393921 RepID=A0AB34PIJ9_9PORP|nr:hypothetical protein HQ38_03370 [Porphyromonas crevioricanis]
MLMGGSLINTGESKNSLLRKILFSPVLAKFLTGENLPLSECPIHRHFEVSEKCKKEVRFLLSVQSLLSYFLWFSPWPKIYKTHQLQQKKNKLSLICFF